MRFHCIKIKNIASLRGSHTIDFDKIFHNSELFAITGQTGAGKSTILNCISLCLYGSNYKNLNMSDFITLDEDEGEIELEFSLGQQRYQSYWGCKVRGKNHELLKIPKTLRRLSLLHGDQKDLLDKLPEKIIPLSYQQFCKTVILNQGQFADFITSTWSDRKAILEKIYNGEVLLLMSRILSSEIKDVEIEISNLQHQLQGIEAISDDAFAALIKRHQEIEAELFSQKTASDNLKKVFDNFNEIAKLEKEKQIKNEILNKTNQEASEATHQFNQLKIKKENIELIYSEKKRIYQEQLPQLQQLIIEVERSRGMIENIEKINLTISKLTQDKERIIEQQEQLLNKKKKLQEEITFAITCEPDLTLSASIMHTLAQNAREYQLLFQSVKSDHSLITSEQNRLSNIKLKVNHVNEQLTASNQKLSELGKTHLFLYQQDSPQNLIAKFTSDRDQILQDINTLEYFKQSVNLINQEQDNLFKEINKKERELNKLNQNNKQLIIDIERVNTGISARQEIQNIGLLRKKSIAQKQCLICGSSDLTHLHLESELTTEIELLNQKEQLLVQEQKELEKNLARLDSDIIGLKKAYEKNSATAKDHFYKINLISIAELTTNKEWSNTENITNLIALAKNKVEKINKSLSEMSEFNQKEFELKNSISSWHSQLMQLTTEQNDIQTHLDELNRKIQDRKTNLTNYFNIFYQHLTQLKSYLFDGEDLWNYIYTLNEKHQKHQMTIKDSEQTEEVLKVLNKNLLQNQQSQEEQTAILNSTSENLRHIKQDLQLKLLGKDPRDLLNKLRAEEQNAQEEFKNIQTEYTEFDKKLRDLINKCDFIKEQLVGFQTTQIDHIAKFNLYFQSLHFSQSNQAFLTKINVALNHISQLDQTLVNQTLFELEQRYQNELENFKTNNEQKLRFETEIQFKKNAREKHLAIEIQLKKLKESNFNKTAMSEMLSKDKFRDYVLSMLESRLIMQSNIELESLCNGRYFIVQEKKNKNLIPEFYVVDQLKGGLMRKISTLSGGETFMVSLAMALALAELTRGQTEIDSFFIDEGFGTLDAESLEDVIDVLNSIKARGKQIGIISHVKSLTDRISVNIHLTKAGQGNSDIKIIYQ
jgi:exonuclease SbcC